MMNEGGDRLRATYGENLARLVEVKPAHDPTNLVHVDHTTSV
jgi:hypothetical protein